MNNASIDQLPAQYLKFETAPAFGLGSMPAESERTFVLLAHLFPLIIWPWKRSSSPAVDMHGKEALNFGITMLLIMFPLGFISGLLGSVVAMVVSLVTSVASLAVLLLVVYAAIQARAGKVMRYPLNFRLIK